jgi:hypothetical protein
MPKLPLFQEDPMNLEAVEYLREVLAHPEISRNAIIIERLEQIAAHPELPMPSRLAEFVCFHLTLIPTSYLINLLLNSSELDPRRVALQLQNAQGGQPSKRNRMIKDFNEWVLRHAIQARFNPPPLTL